MASPETLDYGVYVNAAKLPYFRKATRATTDDIGEYNLPDEPKPKNIITQDVFFHLIGSKGYVTIVDEDICIILAGKASKTAKDFKNMAKAVFAGGALKNVKEFIIICEKANANFPKLFASEIENPKIIKRFVDPELFGCYCPNNSNFVSHIRLGKNDKEKRIKFAPYRVNTAIMSHTDAACIWYGFNAGDYVVAMPLTSNAMNAELVYEIR